MTDQHHCDMCGEAVTDFYKGDGLQIAYVENNGGCLRPNVPDYAKEQYGAFGGAFVWPTRHGLGCSCNNKRRKEVNQ